MFKSGARGRTLGCFKNIFFFIFSFFETSDFEQQVQFRTDSVQILGFMTQVGARGQNLGYL